MDYKKTIVQIESTIEKLQINEGDLDTLVKDAENAMKLIKLCKERLRKAEEKMTNLFE